MKMSKTKEQLSNTLNIIIMNTKHSPDQCSKIRTENTPNLEVFMMNTVQTQRPKHDILDILSSIHYKHSIITTLC